jgi:hypothetical protein
MVQMSKTVSKIQHLLKELSLVMQKNVEQNSLAQLKITLSKDAGFEILFHTCA